MTTTRLAHHYLELIYEDLVYHPEQELKRICTFIGETYSRKMLAFHKTADRYIKNEPWKAGALRPVNRNSIGRGTRELSAPKTFIIEKLTGRLFQNAGYVRSIANLNIKLLSPFVFMGEISKYLRHRYVRFKSQRLDDDVTIYSDRSRFYRVLLYSIFRKRGW